MQIIAKTSINSGSTKKDYVPFDMDVCFIGDKTKRQAIESFIQAGYKKSFNANIAITMPALLYIEDKNLKAALGMRGHNDTFFIEQYLDKPVLSYIQQQLPDITTDQIVEIGSLYSNSNRFTIPLFMVTAVTCYLLGKKALVLCGTEHVIDLLRKSGVAYQKIAKAQQDKLLPSEDSWGTYYFTNPQVVSVSLDSIMMLIEENRFYKKLFHRLSEKIESSSKKLAGKL